MGVHKEVPLKGKNLLGQLQELIWYRNDLLMEHQLLELESLKSLKSPVLTYGQPKDALDRKGGDHAARTGSGIIARKPVELAVLTSGQPKDALDRKGGDHAARTGSGIIA